MADKPRVAIAFVHPDAGRVTSFEESLWALRDYDAAHDNVIHRRIKVRYGTDGIVAARNEVVAEFLAKGDCDWLLWVDTDMGFEFDALDKLLAVAHPETRPVVGGLCFASRHVASDGMNGWWTRPQPTLFDWRDNPDGGSGFLYVPVYPVNGMFRVAATGCAFILIHRSAFEKIADEYGPTWYDRTPAPNGELLGEDISFCVRCALVEAPIYVHTGVRTSHYKGQWVQEIDHWRHYEAPPATERTAVIVPTLGRPQNAEPFMASLRASSGLVTAYAVCDENDPGSAEAWRAAGAEVIVDNLVTFAKKANLGFSKTSEPWLFLVGDDVKFHPGWLDQAQHVADVFNADVIGTNDMGNVRVMKGEHATHMLIRRSYVDGAGATWDGAGVLAHEGYRHNFIDDELVTAAKVRGVWQMALGSVVEHRHPIWGKGDDDDTYKVGQESFDADRELFIARLAVNAPQVRAA